MTALPGLPMSSAEFDARQEESYWQAAGAWLARWHRSSSGPWFGVPWPNGTPQPPGDETDAAPMMARTIEEWLSRGKDAGLLSAAETAFAEWALASADALDAEQPTPCHGDYRPQNWIIDHTGRGEARWSGVIDFEYARWDIRLADIGHRWDRGLAGRADRRDAFFAGYGGLPTPTERTQLHILRLVGALSRIVGGHLAARAEVEQLGRNTLRALAEAAP